MEKVLVIGGCGYIGTRLVQTVKVQGYDTMSMDLNWFGNHTTGENLQQDFRHIDAMYLSQFAAVILLAGHSSVKMCEGNLSSCFQNNVVNFISLLGKLQKNQKFIYASSSSIYGGLGDEEMVESTHLYRPLNYYDLSKYEIDSYAKLSQNIEYYGLRFGTVNGFSLNFRDEIMLNAMYKNGTREGVINYSSPHIRRPILGITDLCRAVLTILKTGDYSKRGIYNLASFNSTVKEISQQASDILGAKLVQSSPRPNAYDFSISTRLFEENFNFKFQESIASILAEISRGQAQLTFTDRNTPFKYEQA